MPLLVRGSEQDGHAGGMRRGVGPGRFAGTGSVRSGSGRVVNCAQLEGDLIGHELEAGEGGNGVAQGFFCVVGDDEAFDGLTWCGEVGSDVADVAGGLADDFVRWPSPLELDYDERTGRGVGAEEVQSADRCGTLMAGLAVRAGPDFQ